MKDFVLLVGDSRNDIVVLGFVLSEAYVSMETQKVRTFKNNPTRSNSNNVFNLVDQFLISFNVNVVTSLVINSYVIWVIKSIYK